MRDKHKCRGRLHLMPPSPDATCSCLVTVVTEGLCYLFLDVLHLAKGLHHQDIGLTNRSSFHPEWDKTGWDLN